MMYVEESLGTLDVSKLANVPRWSHPFKVDTPQAGLPSADLRSVLIERVKAKCKEELETLQAERELQEQARLDEMVMQMSSADFGSRSTGPPIIRPVKPLTKSDAAIVEEKRRVEQQKRIDEELELEAKRARLVEIDAALKEVESRLETLNSDKHELFVQFRKVKQIEDIQRAEAQRIQEEKRRQEEALRLLSPSPVGVSLSLPHSPVPFTTFSQTPQPTTLSASFYGSTELSPAHAPQSAPPTPSSSSIHNSGSGQYHDNRHGGSSSIDHRRRMEGSSSHHRPPMQSNRHTWQNQNYGGNDSPSGSVNQSGSTNNDRKRTYNQFSEYDKSSSQHHSSSRPYQQRPPFRSQGGTGFNDRSPKPSGSSSSMSSGGSGSYTSRY